MRITKAVAAVLLVVGLVSVTTGIVLATQSTLQQDRHQVNALIFVGVGALLVFDAVILLLRSRAPVIPVTPDFDLGASSGPFGLDGPRALDITRVYRLNHGVLTIAVTGATVVFLSTATALRIQPSLLSGVVGAAIGLALSAYIALALQRSSLEVGPGGITVNGFRMRTPIPWTAVESIGVQKGRCIVRVRNSATSRNPVGIRNRDFSAYLRVPDNASMPGLIARYLSERTPPQPPSFGEVAAQAVGAGPVPPSLGTGLGFPVITTLAAPFMAAMPPPPPPPISVGQEHLMHRRAGFGIRLAAWSIDVVAIAVITFVVAVVIDLFLAGTNRGTVPAADESPALYAGLGITVVVYLTVCWHGGATLGMWILRLRVIDSVSGLAPSWGRTSLRFVVALPSMVVFIPFGLIGVLGHQRLALHDRPARTVVVSIGSHSSPVLAGAPPPSP
ncbi:MAG: RDD family protein [Candidatus Dormiibacterota bacterium]